jgi:aconitate hydratase
MRPGVAMFSIPERATITNMGVEAVTTSVFFRRSNKEVPLAQGREQDWVELKADLTPSITKSWT